MIPNSHQSPSRCWWMLVFYGILSYVFPIYCQKKPLIIAIYGRLTPQIPSNSQRCSGLFSLLLGIRRSDRVWPTSSAKSLGCDAAKPTENKLYRLWSLELSSCRTWGSSTFFTFFWLGSRGSRTKPQHFRIVPLGAFFKWGDAFFFWGISAWGVCSYILRLVKRRSKFNYHKARQRCAGRDASSCLWSKGFQGVHFFGI